jgi:hypothetical protein
MQTREAMKTIKQFLDDDNIVITSRCMTETGLFPSHVRTALTVAIIALQERLDDEEVDRNG